MHSIYRLASSIGRSLSRARLPILTIALTYAISLGVGIGMVHSGNEFALATRDNLVGRANAQDPSSLALQRGDPLSAALIDFGRNLLLGAVPDTVGGLAIIIPYPLTTFRGWVGGIVSVNSAHHSRLADPSQAVYYIAVVVLQLIPYTLATGAGVNLGLAFLHPRSYYQGDKWLGLPKEALRDVLRIYVLVVPLFLIASLIEFLAV